MEKKDMKIKVGLPSGRSVIARGQQFDMSKKEDRFLYIKRELERSVSRDIRGNGK